MGTGTLGCKSLLRWRGFDQKVLSSVRVCFPFKNRTSIRFSYLYEAYGKEGLEGAVILRMPRWRLLRHQTATFGISGVSNGVQRVVVVGHLDTWTVGDLNSLTLGVLDCLRTNSE